LRSLHSKRPLEDHEERLLQGLVHKLAYKDSKSRVAARLALERFGKRALPLLKRNAENEDPEVRLTVIELIEAMEESAEQDKD